jgi:glycosyltransferase involved in cell wall biosynthesis
MPSSPAVVVVVPARDEVRRIPVALDAIATALERTTPGDRLVVVVDDDSTDGTGAAARAALAGRDVDHLVLRVRETGVGRTRQAGVDHVVRHLDPDPRRTWVLSTDADTVVPPSWVERYLAHAAAGARAVAGIVALIPDADGRRIGARWRADYGARVDSSSSHPYVHAANLGVRLDVLQAVGGFPAVEREEDADLWDRIRAAGIEPVADADLVVATSARMRARVPRGFAHALATLYGDACAV